MDHLLNHELEIRLLKDEVMLLKKRLDRLEHKDAKDATPVKAPPPVKKWAQSSSQTDVGNDQRLAYGVL